jgi:glycosyltransferase involved in cell wall biosynthesis
MIFTFYGSDVNHSLQRTISVATARRAARRIFVAQRLADLWPDRRNVVIPNGVDFAACAPRDRGGARVELGLEPEVPLVLFGAHPKNAGKGYDLFREVLERVRRRAPSARELILTEEGQSYARVVAKLNAADVLLFTSRRGTEGSPTVVKEAVAVGLPVVSTDVGDAGAMLAGVEPGGVEPWPASGAREELVVTMADRVAGILTAGRRANGREVRVELRQENVAARILGLYEDVIRESPNDVIT